MSILLLRAMTGVGTSRVSDFLVFWHQGVGDGQVNVLMYGDSGNVDDAGYALLYEDCVSCTSFA